MLLQDISDFSRINPYQLLNTLERGTKMSKKKYKMIGILICIAAIGFGVFYFTNIAPANKVLYEVRNAEIKDIDLNEIADGKYRPSRPLEGFSHYTPVPSTVKLDFEKI
mgnify:CR=1 FL=1